MIKKLPLVKSAYSIIVLFLLSFAVFTTQNYAQVFEDGRSAGGAFNTAGVSQLSWTHNVGSGPNRALFVGISTTTQASAAPSCTPSPCPTTLPTSPLSGTSFTILSVTNNGTEMQPVISSIDVNRQVAIYQMVSPSAGANNIVVTFSPGIVTHASGNSVSFTGVSQTAPFINAAAASGTDSAPILFISGTGAAAGDIVFDALSSTPNAGYFAEGAGQTVCADPADETTCTRGRRFFFNAYDVGASSTEPASPLGTTMSWMMTTGQPWALAATIVKAAPPPTAANASISGRVLTSAGRSISKARVTLTVSSGEIFAATTNAFGFYRFENVPVGKTATIEVRSKLWQIAPRVLTVNENLENLNLIGQD